MRTHTVVKTVARIMEGEGIKGFVWAIISVVVMILDFEIGFLLCVGISSIYIYLWETDDSPYLSASATAYFVSMIVVLVLYLAKYAYEHPSYDGGVFFG